MRSTGPWVPALRRCAPPAAEALPRLLHALLPAEGPLVPVAALEDVPVGDHLEEAAAAQALGIAPFEDGPVAVLEQVVFDADHLGVAELALEHGADRRPAHERIPHDLVVDGVF